MYFTIYKTTNKINQKFYIGMHKTDNLEDGYIGSGKLLKRAIEKYGIENFEKEILFVYNNIQDMIAKEIELITEDEIKNPLCYNLTPGGWGGNRITDANHPIHQPDHCKKMRKAFCDSLSDPLKKERFSIIQSEKMKKNHQAGKIKYDTFSGKKHSDESRLRMSKAKKGKTFGANNSNFGTMWITNGSENLKIKKDSLIPYGWYKGRTMKNI
jgi:hypothetical protein